MTVLSKLKLSDAVRVAGSGTSIQSKRQKLVLGLERQIKCIESAEKNAVYSYDAERVIRNAETGERTRQSVSVRVKSWAWHDAQGKYFTCVKYGNKKLEFQKGKKSIEVGEQKQLVPLYQQLIKGVNAGDFDGLIAEAAVFGSPIKK